MTKELFLAAGLMLTGLCVAGAGANLYQMLTKQVAALRFDGPNFAVAFLHLFISFICGPYIMLQMGWRHEENGTLSMTSALVSAVVAFSWAFVTGTLCAGLYVGLIFGL